MPKERALTRDDSDWPTALDRVSPPVEALRVLGTLPPLRRAVAIVGTRAADEEAIEFTELLAADLARAGCPVVSGGAVGIDAAAHRGALDGGGSTVVVLPTGFDPPYPTGHRSLFERARTAGALVTEVPDGTAAHPGRFLSRNRIIAALARAVVVVQAPVRSGALSTAAVAARIQVPVFTVPSAPWEARGKGSLALLGRGGRVCTSARDVLSLPALGSPGLFVEAPGKPANAKNIADLGTDEQRILSDIGTRPRHPDEITRRTGLPASAVQRGLLQLALHGIVEPREGGRFGRAR